MKPFLAMGSQVLNTELVGAFSKCELLHAIIQTQAVNGHDEPTKLLKNLAELGLKPLSKDVMSKYSECLLSFLVFCMCAISLILLYSLIDFFQNGLMVHCTLAHPVQVL